MNSSIASEFHIVLRVRNLAKSVQFYQWLLEIDPSKLFTDRYAVFLDQARSLNFVIVQSTVEESSTNGQLHHMGIEAASRHDLVNLESDAIQLGFTVSQSVKTTWNGTPLHQLWLVDPDGTDIEVYARLTPAETEASREELTN